VIYLKRLAAVLLVLISLVIFVCLFPVYALIYISTGRDISDKVVTILPGG